MIQHTKRTQKQGIFEDEWQKKQDTLEGRKHDDIYIYIFFCF